MRAGIVLFPGTNRERDMAIALAKVSGGRQPVMIWHKETSLPPLDLIVLPGGFSHGDYLRCGAMAAQSPVMRAVRDFADAGGAVLGVCNGFQILTEAGMLPGALLRNAGLRFLGQDHHLKVEQTDSLYTSGYDQGSVIRVVLAHGDGNYVADTATLDRLEGDGLVAFRYCNAEGVVSDETNPNGSQRNIAGIFSENRRVLGLMPHPEDYVDPLMGGVDGLPMFASIVEGLAA
ncbi:MAG TPA: phosphoribosylformylglycinamidine synthase subunit PurQ [Acidisoma sp.]|uniref:phosphoribosylformylglycinamidine synthase subunit PurQ n=1 Tax=Acidisoma sp. TaxID=1872115 RepID=UPI002C9C6E97|nr:phosphoribosylformylglycinamidine synthase subunit PurQ [Acidisoma sp.]HTI03605.1 phosphoribosylformylglycinamidine synthase subunit PurQ [Acidisoma sp.]